MEEKFEELRDKILEWQSLATALKKAREGERALRDELTDIFLGDDRSKRILRFEFMGMNIEVNQGETRTVDQGALTTVYPELTEEDKKALKFEGKLIAAFYKELPKDSLVHEVVTTRANLPSMKVEFNDPTD